MFKLCCNVAALHPRYTLAERVTTVFQAATWARPAGLTFRSVTKVGNTAAHKTQLGTLSGYSSTIRMTTSSPLTHCSWTRTSNISSTPNTSNLDNRNSPGQPSTYVMLLLNPRRVFSLSRFFVKQHSGQRCSERDPVSLIQSQPDYRAIVHKLSTVTMNSVHVWPARKLINISWSLGGLLSTDAYQ